MTTQPFLYWPKVLNPNAILPQTIPDTQQPRFFFGGSQVPISLEGTVIGSGIKQHKTKTGYKSSLILPSGSGMHHNQTKIQYTINDKHHNIMIPKNLK